MDKKALMFVGVTHSGKTTLARRLQKVIPSSFVVDGDAISVFLKGEFSELFLSEGNNSKDPQKPSMKVSVGLSILDWGILHGFRPILSNGNASIKTRELFIAHLRALGFQIGIVFMNIPSAEIEMRIANTDKTNDCLRVSKSYREVFDRQITSLDVPTEMEVDKLFEIRAIDQISDVIIEIQQWMQ